MKWLAIFLTVFWVQASVAAKQAPTFDTIDTNGNQIALSDLEGKLVVMEWSNHRCPFVKKHYDSQNIQKLQNKYTDQDVVWITVISSAPNKQGHVSADEANQIASKHGATPTHIIIDESGKIGKDYGAKTTPHMFVLSEDQHIIYQGAIDSIASANPKDIETATNYVADALDSAIKGEAVVISETSPYGCSVKY